MQISVRGCGTCKGLLSLYSIFQPLLTTCPDRRISCDRGLPACLHCIRSNRQCQGYGMRFSWPRPNDRKRSILGSAPPAKAKANGVSRLRIVNISNSDIEIHYYLTANRFNTLPAVPAPLRWSPITSDTDYNLLQYCRSTSVLVSEIMY
jgi:hypothetical protein